MQPCVYILASQRNGTLYVGVASDIVKRVWQRKEKLMDGFSKQYGCDMLVWYELHETMESAICREKTIKGWKRLWKLDLIERQNPAWRDLYDELLGLDSGLRRNDGGGESRHSGEGRNPVRHNKAISA